nr:PREDICTED: uncharacterized protein LOC109042098 [Bemisia tabaci]
MEEALKAVREGMSIKRATREHEVPRITLLNKYDGKYPEGRKMGPECILTDPDENRIEDWLKKMARAGFPITKSVLFSCISKYIKEKGLANPSKNDLPGKSWYAGFLRRHPNLIIRTPQNLTSSRGAVTKAQITAWSHEVQAYLTEHGNMEIFEDPNRVFNCDEAAFFSVRKANLLLYRVVIKVFIVQ